MIHKLHDGQTDLRQANFAFISDVLRPVGAHTFLDGRRTRRWGFHGGFRADMERGWQDHLFQIAGERRHSKTGLERKLPAEEQGAGIWVRSRGLRQTSPCLFRPMASSRIIRSASSFCHCSGRFPGVYQSSKGSLLRQMSYAASRIVITRGTRAISVKLLRDTREPARVRKPHLRLSSSL